MAPIKPIAVSPVLEVNEVPQGDEAAALPAGARPPEESVRLERALPQLGNPLLLCRLNNNTDECKRLLLEAAVIRNIELTNKTKVNLRQEIEELVKDPKSKGARVFYELLSIAGQDGRDDRIGTLINIMFVELIRWGVIDHMSDLGGPKGERLLELARLAKGGLTDLVLFGLSKLINMGVITTGDLTKAFNAKEKWLNGLALAAGAMKPEQRWKVFWFGFPCLIDLNIIHKDRLNDALRYEEGDMLFELARAANIVEVAGRDYFGFVLGDWLFETRANALDSKTVGKFIRDTAEAANEFYTAGRRQRDQYAKNDIIPLWRVTVRNFKGMLPTADVATLLKLLAKTLEDPMSEELAELIQKEKGINVMEPSNFEDIRRAKSYGEFLDSLTQRAGLNEQWLKNHLKFDKLNKKYAGRTPDYLFELVTVLNSWFAGLGDTWIKQAGYPVPTFEAKDVMVTLDNLDKVYARWYLIKLLRPEDVEGGKKRYKFVWRQDKDQEKKQVLSLSSVELIMLASEQLESIFGKEEARKIVGAFAVSNVKIDLRTIPEKLMEVKGLDALRRKMNEASSSVKDEEGGRKLMGDHFLAAIEDMLSKAVVVPDKVAKTELKVDEIHISLLVRILFGWSNFAEMSSEYHWRDLEGGYKTRAGYVAEAVGRYFERNKGEFEGREDKDAIRQRCKDLEKPLWMDKNEKVDPALKEFYDNLDNL